jgi:Flp pilus assembly protein TadG
MLRRSRSSSRRAAATVELAVTLAFFIVPVMLGLWEMSCVIEAKQLLDNACREAGRQASTGAKSPTEVETALKNYLKQNGVATTGVVVTLTNLTSSGRADPRYAEQMDRFRVTATVPYADLRTRGTSIVQLLNVAQVKASADWFSMKDIPVTVDGNIPIE